ncbi:MAG: hypothetical protein KF901_04635 [Myxococcales bacterium]|nr:hypothetical protein [Myxococcales bacterium]
MGSLSQHLVRILNGILLALAGLVAGCGALESPEVLDEAGPVILGADGKADGEDVPAFGPLPEDADWSPSVQVLFAPDDPTVTLELSEIARVVSARAADPAAYAEGENPYRVRYAVYNLRNPVLVEALADAEDAGVDVQILIDAAQLDPAKDWNTADERLVERGFELVVDHRTLDARTRISADLIGIERSGLMHLKLRLFETPGDATVITGSMNPGDNAVLNEENLQLIRDPRVVARYARVYEAVRDDRPIRNEWDEGAGANVLFTPAASGPRAGAQLLRWIAEEEELILMMVFSLRDVNADGGSLVALLGRKVAAGVPVYVITDRKQSDGVDAFGNRLWNDDPTEDRLRAVGVHVYEATNLATEFTAMHHKTGIFGLSRVRVVTDAANWTFSGLGSRTRVAPNVESQLYLDTAALDGGLTGRRYLAQWLRVLERYAHQSAGDGEPAFEVVRDQLFAMPGWPTQAVAFDTHVQTAFGEQVEVRGGADALGGWGAGLGLATDGETYPWWRGEAALRLGERFAWKLVVRGVGGTRWERGDDRVDYASPEALRGPTRVISARWR